MKCYVRLGRGYRGFIKIESSDKLIERFIFRSVPVYRNVESAPDERGRYEVC